MNSSGKLISFQVLLFFSELLNLTFGANSPKSHLIPCSSCCPSLFHSTQGVVNIRDSHYLVHSLSYQMRCLLSTEDVIIVSDTYLSTPFLYDLGNANREGAMDGRSVCTSPEQIPFAIVSAKQFLTFDLGFLQKVIHASPPSTSSVESLLKSTQPSKRVSFLIAAGSHSQMVSLIQKVDKELQLLRADKKLFWQPKIIFVWHEIQHIAPDIYHGNTNSSMIPTFNSSPSGKSLLHSWFNNYQPQFTLDSGIFFFFMVQKGNSSRSQKNLYMSIWEGYSLKGDFMMKQVTDNLYQPHPEEVGQKEETCSSILRDERLISTENVNAYFFMERFRRRENFGQRRLVAAISESSKWVQLKRNKDGSILLEKGGSVYMYRDFQLMMNFSEKVVLGDRPLWTDSVSNNDTSVTVTGQLNTDAVDISLNQETVTPSRGQAQTFLQPTYYGTFHAFFLQPADNTIRNIVTAPFTEAVWTALLCAWILTVLCVNGFGYAAKMRNLDSRKDLNFFGESEMWSIAAICQKAWYISPKTPSFKIMFFLSSILTFVMYSYYSATIVSFLTVKTLPIQSVGDLVEYRYRFSVHEQSEASVLLAQKLINSYNLSQNVSLVTTANEVSHILIPSNALLAYPDLFYKTAENQTYAEEFICTNISTISVQNVPYKSSMSVKKGSQYHELISEKLLMILERGLNYRYIKMYEDSRGYTCSKDYQKRTVVDPVRFRDVLISFLIVIIGWFVATVIFLVERMLHLRRKYFYLV